MHSRVAPLGRPVLTAHVRSFADGEVQYWLPTPLAPHTPIAIAVRLPEELFTLALLADAARRAGATEVWAFAPYIGYMRQDKLETVAPEAAPASFGMAALGKQLAACVDGIFIYAPHSPEGLQLWPQTLAVQELPALPALANAVKATLQTTPLVVVATDAGGMARAQQFAALLGADTHVAQIEKKRLRPNEVASAQLVEGRISGRHAVLIDDMIDTAGTLCAAAEVCRANGAVAVSAAAVHGIFSPPAATRLETAGFDHIWVLDTRPILAEITASLVPLPNL